MRSTVARLLAETVGRYPHLQQLAHEQVFVDRRQSSVAGTTSVDVSEAALTELSAAFLRTPGSLPAPSKQSKSLNIDDLEFSPQPNFNWDDPSFALPSSQASNAGNDDAGLEKERDDVQWGPRLLKSKKGAKAALRVVGVALQSALPASPALSASGSPSPELDLLESQRMETFELFMKRGFNRRRARSSVAEQGITIDAPEEKGVSAPLEASPAPSSPVMSVDMLHTRPSIAILRSMNNRTSSPLRRPSEAVESLAMPALEVPGHVGTAALSDAPTPDVIPVMFHSKSEAVEFVEATSETDAGSDVSGDDHHDVLNVEVVDAAAEVEPAHDSHAVSPVAPEPIIALPPTSSVKLPASFQTILRDAGVIDERSEHVLVRDDNDAHGSRTVHNGVISSELLSIEKQLSHVQPLVSSAARTTSVSPEPRHTTAVAVAPKASAQLPVRCLSFVCLYMFTGLMIYLCLC